MHRNGTVQFRKGARTCMDQTLIWRGFKTPTVRGFKILTMKMERADRGAADRRPWSREDGTPSTLKIPATATPSTTQSLRSCLLHTTLCMFGQVSSFNWPSLSFVQTMHVSESRAYEPQHLAESCSGLVTQRLTCYQMYLKLFQTCCFID